MHIIVGFSCAVVCKVHVHISSWTMQAVIQDILDRKYYGRCQVTYLATYGYVCGGPALWTLGLFLSWSRLDSLVGPRLLGSLLSATTSSDVSHIALI